MNGNRWSNLLSKKFLFAIIALACLTILVVTHTATWEQVDDVMVPLILGYLGVVTYLDVKHQPKE